MKTDVSISIGARIRHFRELAGLSQLQLSEKFNVNRQRLHIMKLVRTL